MSINGWLDKQKWFIRAMEYYSAIKRDEALIHALGCTKFGIIVPVERSQPQKDHIFIIWFYLCEVSSIGKSIETESRFVVAKDWGGKWGVTNKAYGVSSGHDENVMELVGCDDCTNASLCGGVGSLCTGFLIQFFSLILSRKLSHKSILWIFILAVAT